MTAIKFFVQFLNSILFCSIPLYFDWMVVSCCWCSYSRSVISCLSCEQPTIAFISLYSGSCQFVFISLLFCSVLFFSLMFVCLIVCLSLCFFFCKMFDSSWTWWWLIWDLNAVDVVGVVVIVYTHYIVLDASDPPKQ